MNLRTNKDDRGFECPFECVFDPQEFTAGKKLVFYCTCETI